MMGVPGTPRLSERLGGMVVVNSGGGGGRTRHIAFEREGVVVVGLCGPLHLAFEQTRGGGC